MSTNGSFYESGVSYGVPLITPENTRAGNGSFYSYSLSFVDIKRGRMDFSSILNTDLIALLEDI